MSDARSGSPSCRLCLVTPHDIEPEVLAARRRRARRRRRRLPDHHGRRRRLQRLAEALVPRAQARGVAALVLNDTRIAGRARADGVHVDSGIADLAAASGSSVRSSSSGPGAPFASRGDEGGEADPDYLFFGRLDGDGGRHLRQGARPRRWWSSVFLIPAIVMGGRTIASVGRGARGHRFRRLLHAVFADPRGPGQSGRGGQVRLSRIVESAA